MRELDTNDTEIALTLGRTRGVGVDTTPPRKVFLIFFFPRGLNISMWRFQ